ncbi:MAG: hypothetical protein EP312_04605 [Gammaproteobacteria bacterium]|nr:MAG: hypothetical protein EP312_04605 [Gammaproteobacteria bacterium]
MANAWPKPGINKDTEFFWEGLKHGQLLIQRCKACKTLRHPPGPVCQHCHSFEWDTVASSGKGTIHSFVKMHHPDIPVFDKPNPIGLIDLEEGTRIVGRLVNFGDREVTIGTAVEVVIEEVEPGLRLAFFQPAGKGA